MAGKDDLRLLASHVYSLLQDKDLEDNEAEALAAVTMNRAISTGSLVEAVKEKETPMLVEAMSGQIRKQDLGKFNKIVQRASMMLKGADDITKGATEFYPKRAKVDKRGIVKTYSTKNFTFCRPKAPKGRMQEVPSAPLQTY